MDHITATQAWVQSDFGWNAGYNNNSFSKFLTSVKEVKEALSRLICAYERSLRQFSRTCPRPCFYCSCSANHILGSDRQ